MVEGRSLVRYLPGEVNTFLLKGINLWPSDVQVSCSNGDVVGIINVVPDTVEVSYLVHDVHDGSLSDAGFYEGHGVVITICIADRLHSNHTVGTGLSKAVAMDYFKYHTVICQKSVEVLTDHGHNRAVLLSAIGVFRLLWIPGNEDLRQRAVMCMIEAATRHPLTDSIVQTAVLNFIKEIALMIHAEHVHAVADFIYAVMDAHSTFYVQSYGCWAIRYLAKSSPEAKSILLKTRALEVHSRAVKLFVGMPSPFSLYP